MRPISALLLLLASSQAQAEQSTVFGPYVIHYSALTSDFIPPEVARQHEIRRSTSRGLVTINVQRQDRQGGWGLPAQVEATASNRLGETRRIDMREIREGDAIYYVGTFPIVNEEILEFDVKVKPEESTERYSLDFRQQFFLP